MTDAELYIRCASRADVARLTAFARQSFRETYSATNQPKHIQEHIETVLTIDEMAKFLGTETNRTLLAIVGGELRGYAQLRCNSPCPAAAETPSMELMRIYVDSATQGIGVGSRLIREAVALAADTGHRSVWLQVWEKNPGATQFYARHGFAAVGHTSFMLGPERQSDIVMARRITPDIHN